METTSVDVTWKSEIQGIDYRGNRVEECFCMARNRWGRRGFCIILKVSAFFNFTVLPQSSLGPRSILPSFSLFLSSLPPFLISFLLSFPFPPSLPPFFPSSLPFFLFIFLIRESGTCLCAERKMISERGRGWRWRGRVIDYANSPKRLEGMDYFWEGGYLVWDLNGEVKIK